MVVKILDHYKGNSHDTPVQVVGLSTVLGVTYVAFREEDDRVFWHSEDQFLANYSAKQKYLPGDILEFSDKERYGAKVRVLVLDAYKALRIGEWGDFRTPSQGGIDYYLSKMDSNPEVLGNYKHLLAEAFGGNK